MASLSMNAIDREVSYANNSSLQKKIQLKTREILEDTIKDMLIKIFPVTCFKMADLGCASGPNSYSPTYEVIDIITRICKQQHWESPEIQVFLNDLPHNDFNSVFSLVPTFISKLKGDLAGDYFVAGVAGSFYERLFPSKTMHFIHSSFSLHWLSKVPGGVENNKGNIYMAKSSPPNVFKAYFEQFENNFTSFLRSRSVEMIGGGKMLVTLNGRSSTDPTNNDCSSIWELLAKSLMDLVNQGLVQESDVDSFNMPYYNPCEDDLRDIIEKEGSFVLEKIEIFEVNWDFEDDDCNENCVLDKSKSGKNVANCIRAISEPTLAGHFGETIMDDLFSRFAQHVGQHLSHDKTKFVCIVVIMSRLM